MSKEKTDDQIVWGTGARNVVSKMAYVARHSDTLDDLNAANYVSLMKSDEADDCGQVTPGLLAKIHMELDDIFEAEEGPLSELQIVVRMDDDILKDLDELGLLYLHRSHLHKLVPMS